MSAASQPPVSNSAGKGIRDAAGRFVPGHNAPGPGRPKGSGLGIEAFIRELTQTVERDPERFVQYIVDGCENGDSTCLQIVAKRAWPETMVLAGDEDAPIAVTPVARLTPAARKQLEEAARSVSRLPAGDEE